ncbi:MAG: hypothetical protein Q7K26_01995 [bacterium]|nr:hypothetical protein [bacterium]
MKSTQEQVERGIELLTLCQNLQSDKDGVERSEPFKVGAHDAFSKDIEQACTNLAALNKLIPMMLKLAEIGRKLESAKKIEVDYGGDYSEAALKYLAAEHHCQ